MTMVLVLLGGIALGMMLGWAAHRDLHGNADKRRAYQAGREDALQIAKEAIRAMKSRSST